MSDKKQLTNTVKWLLENEPETRDNNKLLCSRIWAMQLRKQGKGIEWFISEYVANKLYEADTITRLSRLIQEKHPELRGKDWDKRHKKQETVKQDIREYKRA